jgi:hypothetical protein
MTITIQLSDEQAAALEAQAAKEGLSVETWLQRLAEQYAQSRLPEAQHANNRPVWQIVAEAMQDVPDEVLQRLPGDGASEHDHYLYGWPKRDR